MPGNSDQIRSQRDRQVEADEQAARIPARPLPPPTLAGTVVNGGSIPTSAPGQFLLRPFRVLDPVVEGGPVTLTVDSAGDQVVTVVGGVPAVGEGLIATRSNGRWFAEYQAGSPPPCTGQLCVDFHDTAGARVFPATFRVTGPGGFDRTGTTTSYGPYCWGDLPPGPYLVRVLEVPAGYTLPADSTANVVCDSRSISGCPCHSLPDSFFMHVSSQPAGVLPSFVFPATLQWGPKPADLFTYRADDPGYYSTAIFTSSDGNYRYRYRFACLLGFYYIGGLMTPDSPVGYPGDFTVMQWLAGLPGNTCTPFSFTNGSSDSPVYRLQGITLSGGGTP